MRIFFLLILIFSIFHIYAQEETAVSGQVIDSLSNLPIPYATIIVNGHNNTNFKTGTISNQNGVFSVGGLMEGSYTIHFSFLGYMEKERDFVIGQNKTIDLGKILLLSEAQNIDEIIVSAQRQIRSSALDKMVITIDDNIAQGGSSVLDVLRDIPSLQITPEGKINIRGSENIAILIDGKPSSLGGFGHQGNLDNLPAANIEKIEVINNPSAQYGSSGMSGIINIIFKKENETGWHGEMGLSGGLGELTERRGNLSGIQKKYEGTPKLNPNLSLNYNTSKLRLFLNADGIIRRRINNNTFSTRSFSNGSSGIQSQFLENRSQHLYNLKGGLDYAFNPKNTLTVFTLWQDEYHIDRGDVPYENMETGERIRFWEWDEDERTRFINYSATYTHQFQSIGHQLALQYLYTGGGEDELFPFHDESENRNSFDETFLKVYEYVHQWDLDYSKPLAAGRLDLGSSIRIRKIPVRYTITPGVNSILDPNLGQRSDYQEDIYAFYSNYLLEKTNFSLEIGLRLEPTNVQFSLDPANDYYQLDEYSYFSLFPNTRISFMPAHNLILSLFYNRRIDRPTEFEIRPFPKYDDPEILKTGNPYLRPQFTSNYEMGIRKSWDIGSFYAAFFHREIKDLIQRIYVQDNRDPLYEILHYIPTNLDKSRMTGMEFNFQQRLSPSLNLDANFSWFQKKIAASDGITFYPEVSQYVFDTQKGDSWNAKISAKASLPLNSNFQISLIHYSPEVIPQGKRKSRSSLDIGWKVAPLGSKSEWRLSITDLLNTFDIEEEIDGDVFKINTSNFYETQVITVGWKKKF